MDVVRFAAADDVDQLSGWYIVGDDRPSAPVLVAIHGGSSTSSYWSLPGMGGDTLAHVAGAAGITVVAVDRPTRSAGDTTRAVGIAEQASRVVRTVARILSTELGRPGPVPVLPVGHSIGGMVATHIAAREWSEVRVVGLEISGIGLRYRDDAPMAALRAAAALDVPVPPSPGSRRRFFGPPDGWDADVAAEDAAAAVPADPHDVAAVIDWPAAFPALARQVRVPVRYVVGEHDIYWPADKDAIAEVAGAFRGARSFDSRVIAGAGHSLHLHHGAGAALRALIMFADGLTAAPTPATTNTESRKR